MDTNIEMIADYQCVLGENPLWHSQEKRLYWTDIDTGRLFRYDPATEADEQCYEGALVGGFTVQQDGALLLFGDRGAISRWADGVLSPIVEAIPGEEAHRFNDVIADPAGRVFCGTLCRTERLPGRLYRLDTDGTLTKILDGIGCSNGMGFTADRRTMYYTDSVAQTIYRFDYDADSGALSRQRVFAKITEPSVSPDGLTVDAEGGVWSALWGKSCIVRFTAEGVEDQRIPLPATNVTSVAFGGEDLGDLYITTAGANQRDIYGPGAGALYRVRPGVRGMTEFTSSLAIG